MSDAKKIQRLIEELQDEARTGQIDRREYRRLVMVMREIEERFLKDSGG